MACVLVKVARNKPYLYDHRIETSVSTPNRQHGSCLFRVNEFNRCNQWSNVFLLACMEMRSTRSVGAVG